MAKVNFYCVKCGVVYEIEGNPLTTFTTSKKCDTKLGVLQSKNVPLSQRTVRCGGDLKRLK